MMMMMMLISLLYASTCFEHCCAYHQEVKIVLYIIRYRHTETSEWSKMYEFIHKFYYYVLIFIEWYFSNFRPLNCFSVMITDSV